MNCELDPIASYHHHVPDSWNSSPKAHQASWESLVSECVPPLTDPHRKRGRSSRILYPLSRSSSFARPSVSFVVWTRIRVIVHPASNATHTHTQSKGYTTHDNSIPPWRMCFFLRGFNNPSRARRNNGCPDAATTNLADNAQRSCPSLCRGTTCRKEEGHR